VPDAEDAAAAKFASEHPAAVVEMTIASRAIRTLRGTCAPFFELWTADATPQES